MSNVLGRTKSKNKDNFNNNVYITCLTYIN